MAKTITLMLLPLVVFVAGLSAFNYWSSLPPGTPPLIKCTAPVTLFSRSTITHLNLDIMIDQEKHTGIITLSGSINEEAIQTGKLRREILFSFTRDHDTYRMTSTKIVKFSNIDTLSNDYLATLLPDFYLYPDRFISYAFVRQGDKGYMISIAKQPILFCAR